MRTCDFQRLFWLPKLAISGLVSQTDGIIELNYGGTQMVFGKCDGLVHSSEMTAIKVLEEFSALQTMNIVPS